MSELIFTKEKLQILYNHRVMCNEDRIKKIRENKIQDEVTMLTIQIFNANSKGYKTYSKYVYKEDETFVSDIADKLCKRFEDSIITVDKNTMWRLFNYCMITVTW
jgi:hypothetical protein